MIHSYVHIYLEVFQNNETYLICTTNVCNIYLIYVYVCISFNTCGTMSTAIENYSYNDCNVLYCY